MDITFTDHQWAGVQKAADWFHRSEYTTDSFTFSGYAGTGKSTCVGAMIAHLGLQEDEVMYMAPTGKAAKVLTRKLKESGWATAATTIHKAIYMPKTAKADAIDRKIEALNNHVLWMKSNGEAGTEHSAVGIQSLDLKSVEDRIAELTLELSEAMNRDGPKFNLKSFDDIDEKIKLFVCDEASMVGTEVARDLACFGRPILAVGDPGQLPPVADTWGFAMGKPDVFLTEIHRQAADNPIIHLATLAREDKEIKIGSYGPDVKVVSRRNDDVTLNMDREAMVLVGTNKKRWAITKKIRAALGHLESGPMAGEPLLICKNSARIPDLVNGTLLTNLTDYGDLTSGRSNIMLTLRDDDAGGVERGIACVQGLFEEHIAGKRGAHSAPDRAAFRASKSCEHADWGHVLTVHKSQGSEFDDVVVHDESGVFRQDAARWLYTGITRAAKKLTIVI